MRKKILITGASSGIGAQLAREYAARGRDLALCARRTERLTELRDELRAAHPGVTICVRALDVTDHERVFTVFEEFADELGGLDRVIVNAGIGKGAPLGTGRFDANLATAQTNFVAALAQCEAALTVFRRQHCGHLVLISSIAAYRGLPRAVTTYAATKAGIATLAEGIRAELLGTPIEVSTIFPGYIESELTGDGPAGPLMSGTRTGVRAIRRAIEREPATARVPWQWEPLAVAMKHLPLSVVARFV